MAASGAGDNQEVEVLIDLPPNFCYAMTDFLVSIAGVAFNFDATGELSVFDSSVSANRTMDIPIGLFTDGVGSTFPGVATQMASYRAASPWSGIFCASPVSPGDQIRVFASLFNTTANDNEYTVDVAARFLQFDINQVNNSRVNSPIPVR